MRIESCRSRFAGMFENIIIVTGHYGSGKTNLALNLAMELRACGGDVTLADLDIVNPYFRTADFGEIARQYGVGLLASDYAGSSLDIPALSGSLDAKLNTPGTLVIDVGGDDAGAHALGRYAPRISQRPYTMLYVINRYRYLMCEPEDSAALLRDIEAVSRLEATHIVNCSSLGTETTAQDVRASIPYAEKIAELTGLPLLLTAADKRICADLSDIRDLLPVEIYVRTPWNQGS